MCPHWPHSCWEVVTETNCPVNMRESRELHYTEKEPHSLPAQCGCRITFATLSPDLDNVQNTGFWEDVRKREWGRLFVVETSSQWQAQRGGALRQVVLTNSAQRKTACFLSESSGLVTSLSFSTSRRGREDTSTLLHALLSGSLQSEAWVMARHVQWWWWLLFTRHHDINSVANDIFGEWHQTHYIGSLYIHK